VALIQSASCFSHFYFPRSCPTKVGHFIIIPSPSGRSRISFRAYSSFGCMHLRKFCVQDILNVLHHQHLSDISSSHGFSDCCLSRQLIGMFVAGNPCVACNLLNTCFSILGKSKITQTTIPIKDILCPPQSASSVGR
jgi:hypothetical protein